jgi:hypothetical protein
VSIRITPEFSRRQPAQWVDALVHLDRFLYPRAIRVTPELS